MHAHVGSNWQHSNLSSTNSYLCSHLRGSAWRHMWQPGSKRDWTVPVPLETPCATASHTALRSTTGLPSTSTGQQLGATAVAALPWQCHWCLQQLNTAHHTNSRQQPPSDINWACSHILDDIVTAGLPKLEPVIVVQLVEALRLDLSPCVLHHKEALTLCKAGSCVCAQHCRAR